MHTRDEGAEVLVIFVCHSFFEMPDRRLLLPLQISFEDIVEEP